jgi:transcriptional/translational regulatory protein YebC/TACO1
VEAGDHIGSVLKLLDAIEDHDDVQHVWSNFEADDAALEAAESG